MATTVEQMRMIFWTLLVLSCIFAILAGKESDLKWKSTERDALTCKYPLVCDQSVVYGYLSFAFWLATTVVGCRSLRYLMEAGSFHKMFCHATTALGFCVCYILAMINGALASRLVLPPTINRQRELSGNVHSYYYFAAACFLNYGALFAWISAIFWLFTRHFVNKVRELYFDRV